MSAEDGRRAGHAPSASDLTPELVWRVIQEEGWKRLEDAAVDASREGIENMVAAFTTGENVSEFRPIVVAIGATKADPTHLEQENFAPEFLGTEEDMIRAMTQVGREAFETGILPYVVYFACETWVANRDTPDATSEVILITGMTADGRRTMSTLPMERRADGTFGVGDAENVRPASQEEVAFSELLTAFYAGYFMRRLEETDSGE